MPYGYRNYGSSLTKKEIWIGLGVLALSLAIAFFIEPFVKDNLLKEIKTYNLALQITDPIQFQYADKTQVGNVLAYGEMDADSPASFPELKQGFAMISKIKEEYTMHTRIVCTGSGNSQHCTTETYWSWDQVDHENLASGTFTFLGKRFNFSDLDIPLVGVLPLNADTMYDLTRVEDNYKYDAGLFGGNGDTRYYYKVTPLKFNATMFVRFYDGKASNPSGKGQIKIFYEKPIAQVIQEKKNGLIIFDWLWFIGWTVILTASYFWYAYSIIDIE